MGAGADLSGTSLILVTAPGAKLNGADLRFADAVGIDFDKADLRWSDLRNADFTKANIATARLWGCKVKNTKLPPNMGHWTVLLKISQVFQSASKRADKMKEARERKRIRQVAELVREREKARKRRAR